MCPIGTRTPVLSCPVTAGWVGNPPVPDLTRSPWRRRIAFKSGDVRPERGATDNETLQTPCPPTLSAFDENRSM
jgi:hypothetical protein